MTQEKEKVYKRIKKKFGSLSKFARLASHDRYELQKIFARKQPDREILKSLTRIAKETNVVSTAVEISNAHRLQLKEKMEEHGGPLPFCREYPLFSFDLIFQVMSGKRKRLTPKVKQLFSFLGIE